MGIESSHVDRIRATFPTLTLDSVRCDPDGLANTVVIVNEDLVFRFPKDEGARTNDLSWLAVHIGRARDAMPLGATW